MPAEKTVGTDNKKSDTCAGFSAKTNQQIVFMIAEISEISVNTASIIFICPEYLSSHISEARKC